ncbi:hypothetical protein MC885_017783 [Smutsia gigantea]|nr:hypothetical protein MC885_017783 [Smutsia gigantea]
MRKKSIKRKQNAQPLVENTAEEKGFMKPSPRQLEQAHVVQIPRKSFTKEVLGDSYNIRLITTSSVTGAVIVLITAFFLIKVRTAVSSGFQNSLSS